MFTFKDKYFLIIESIKDLDINKIKLINKYIIIYRNTNKLENLQDLIRFRRFCRSKKITFFVANNVKLSTEISADGIYISAHNNNLNLARFKNSNYKLIGSAHNLKELKIKISQGCTTIIYSRLFKVSHEYKRGYLGVIKYNLFRLSRNENIIPLGGIKISNLNKLKMVKTNSFAIMSEIKKKPAKIFNRLF